MRIAVITVAHGRRAQLRRQQDMLVRSTVAPDDYVVVAMDDPSLPSAMDKEPEPSVVHVGPGTHGLPVAAARNAGAATALARGADLLIFLDVDCLPDPELVRRYQDAAGHRAASTALLCGPVAYLPPPPASGYDLDALAGYPFHPARPAPPVGELVPDGDPRLFWSLSFALTADTWRRVAGFDARYEGYGAEDTDFAFAAQRAGVTLTWVGGAAAYHQWHPSPNPPVHHLADIVRNAAIFADRWGWWPMEGWLAEFVRRGLIHWDDSTRSYVVREHREELVS